MATNLCITPKWDLLDSGSFAQGLSKSEALASRGQNVRVMNEPVYEGIGEPVIAKLFSPAPELQV